MNLVLRAGPGMTQLPACWIQQVRQVAGRPQRKQYDMPTFACRRTCSLRAAWQAMRWGELTHRRRSAPSRAMQRGLPTTTATTPTLCAPCCTTYALTPPLTGCSCDCASVAGTQAAEVQRLQAVPSHQPCALRQLCCTGLPVPA